MILIGGDTGPGNTPSTPPHLKATTAINIQNFYIHPNKDVKYSLKSWFFLSSMAAKRIEIIISELDFFLINRIRELRENAVPRMAQNSLSRELGFAEGYISKVENFKERAKYNLWVLNRIGKILKLRSFNDMFPPKFLPQDIVKIQLEYPDTTPIPNPGNKRPFRIISKTPLTEKEMEQWKRNELKYCTML